MKQALKPKKTFAEAIEERLKTISEARREKQSAEKREQFREVEDEVMAMTHGPHWRTRYPGEPVPEEVPKPQESEVRLKAS